MSEATLFVRKASGLVRAWSIFDAFIYATFSINLITLGLFIFSYCYYFQGNLATAVIVGAAFTVFEVIVYASLISVMPRAGGDYVWQSRILGRGVGFILTVTGWWFILWLWTPLYGEMLNYEFFTPILGVLGFKDAALWFTTSNVGSLVGMLVVCLIVFIYVGVGMKWYARVQKVCFWGGLVGLAGVFLLLLFGSHQAFVNGLNAYAPKLFGAQAGTDLYAATLAAGKTAGTVASPLHLLFAAGTLAIVPMITFYNLWPNWGSTLYGEVRGASDYRRNFMGMFAAIAVTTVLALVFFLLIAKTIGWDFYNKANGAFWNWGFGYTTTQPPLPFWPYPALFAVFLVNSPVIQFLIILLMSLWWFGWSGTLFLSSTRVIFAAAFDRMLPEWVSKVETRTKTPINALLLMVIPSVIISFLYAYNVVNFKSVTLDATVVIAITFLGSTLAGTILPWRQKEMFRGSPISRYKVPKWVAWVLTVVFAAFAVYLIYLSAQLGSAVLMSLPAVPGTPLQWISAGLIAVLSVVNAVLLIWVVYTVARKIFGGDDMPLITAAGLIFLGFLDWLLVVWFWDPSTASGSALYAIGWGNATSMVFMVAMYVLAAVIYFGFNAYRKRQGVNVDMLFKEIPAE
ncbi:MAG: APC family permease [Anaerolineales bacterium]|jgi:amino acid transporter